MSLTWKALRKDLGEMLKVEAWIWEVEVEACVTMPRIWVNVLGIGGAGP